MLAKTKTKTKTKPLPTQQQVDLFFSLIKSGTATALSKKRTKLNIQGCEKVDGKTIVSSSIDLLLPNNAKVSSQRRNSQINWLIELSWWPRAQRSATDVELATLEFLSISHGAHHCAAKFNQSLLARNEQVEPGVRAAALSLLFSKSGIVQQSISDILGRFIFESEWSWSSKAECLVKLFQKSSTHFMSEKLLAAANASIGHVSQMDTGWKTPLLTTVLFELACGSATKSLATFKSQQQREQVDLRKSLLRLAQAGVAFNVHEVPTPIFFHPPDEHAKETFAAQFLAAVQATALTHSSPTHQSGSPRFRL